MAACLLIAVFVLFIGVQAQSQELTPEFTPTLTAQCKTGHMSIVIRFNQPFYGVAHAKEFRTPACMAFGNGSETLTLDINLMATISTADYCGVVVNNRTDERSLPLAVRVHRTLELADDKSYYITCGKTGFTNSNNETSIVTLKLLNEDSKKVTNAGLGMFYTLRAELSKPDGTHNIRLKNCFAFNLKNPNVPLIDSRGCSVHSAISQVKYDGNKADINIASMFKFPESSQINFQCDIGICKGTCPSTDCTSEDPIEVSSEERTVTASTGVFVLDPSDKALALQSCDGGIHPPWLLWLAIALGVMFVIMLLINCFLCTAMTCSCARTEVIEKDPSVLEDYDPYRSWHGSQYGRYPSSTLHSARSISDNSDHYAIVQSRPDSRHSGMHRGRH